MYLIRNIFRNTNPTPHEQVALKASAGQKDLTASISGKRGKVNDRSTAEQGVGSSPTFNPVPRRVFHPRGFECQLPPFSLPYRKVTNTPETKPTLAYVVVGPRVRGKFDAVKANELKGPNGPPRRELTKGNAITFMVSDELGGSGMVERTVQPEDIIGPSECPSVSNA